MAYPAPAPRALSVVRSARAPFAHWRPAALGASFRPSVRSFTGLVAVVRFSDRVAASRFAERWASRLGPACRWCAVRPAPAGGWLVSVPVVPSPASSVGAVARFSRLAASRAGLPL